MPSNEFFRTLMEDCGGAVPVERFMQEALYHPDHGYYSRRVRDVGRSGDFSTSATLHGALGRAIAAWAAHHRGTVARRGRWHLIELGGGSGELAAQILASLPWWKRFGLRYHLVEISQGLCEAQQRRLTAWKRVCWHDDIRAALADAGGHALIFSNEFVDAFPCVQLTRNDPSEPWRQVCVTWPDCSAGPVETTRAWTGPPVTFTKEKRVEVHFAYQRWLACWRSNWRAGRLLTIDYGDTLPGLYHRQPHGTLRAYWKHQRFTGLDVYRRFGQQDLTADVNFTDLQTWGDTCGLATVGFGTQADFLRKWLPARWLARERDEPALAYLLDPAGAGTAFKVLDQIVCNGAGRKKN